MNRKTRKSSTLDLGMSAFAGASVAFAIFTMPGGAFQEAVALSGLPMILPAAEPPLGATARLLAALLGGACAFALAWLALRSIGSKPAPRRQASRPVEIDVLPRIKRADAHPDAPARRPIFAALDLGEPAEAEEAREPLLSTAPEITQEPAEEPAQPVASLGQAEEAPPVPAAPAQPPEMEQNSIAHLMQRLELGLARREGSGKDPIGVAPVWQPAPAPSAAIDERLRGAIADLQKLAARSG